MQQLVRLLPACHPLARRINQISRETLWHTNISATEPPSVRICSARPSAAAAVYMYTCVYITGTCGIWVKLLMCHQHTGFQQPAKVQPECSWRGIPSSLQGAGVPLFGQLAALSPFTNSSRLWSAGHSPPQDLGPANPVPEEVSETHISNNLTKKLVEVGSPIPHLRQRLCRQCHSTSLMLPS